MRRSLHDSGSRKKGFLQTDCKGTDNFPPDKISSRCFPAVIKDFASRKEIRGKFTEKGVILHGRCRKFPVRRLLLNY